jgi:hypothetical protein
MRSVGPTVVAVICALFAGLCAAHVTLADNGTAPRISLEKAKDMLDTSGAIFIDVRSGDDWTQSDMKIKGAVREEPKHVSEWMGKYPKDSTLIFYCA